MQLLACKERIICGLLILGMTGSLVAKRHSRVNKVERFEERAKASAKAHSSLASALSKPTKSMSFDDALLAQSYYRDAKELEMVIKCGERILAVGGNQETLRRTRLELAELSLEQEKHKAAIKHAEDYLMYYPGTKESKKARFITLDATYKLQRHSLRDQQKTRETIEKSEAFIEKYPQDTEYLSTVHDMRSKSYLKLIRSELNIIDTQLNAFHYAKSPASLGAANKRLTYLKEKYLPHAPEAHQKIVELEIVLAKASNKPELAQEKQEELKQIAAKKAPLQLAQEDTWPRATFNSVKEFFIEDNQKILA